MAWDEESEPNQLLQDQIRENEAELSARKTMLTKQRIAVIKSTGTPDFTGSNANTPVFGKPTIGM